MQYSGISEERHERADVLQQHFWYMWNLFFYEISVFGQWLCYLNIYVLLNLTF